MGNVHKLQTAESVTETAGLWLSRLDRGLTHQEMDQLRRWLSEDPAHEQVFLAMAKSWDEMTALEALADLFPDPAQRRNKPNRPMLAFAASVCAAILVVGWLVADHFQPESVQTASEPLISERSDLLYETGIGEQSTTVLADGSTIILNTNSLVTVRYSARHRVIELMRGQVHVQVVPDRRRPLSVLAGESIVQAVGTAFAVQLIEGNKTELVVTEGEVLVGTVSRAARTGSSTPPVPVLPQTALRVEEGKELIMGVAAPTVRAVSPEDVLIRMSWREGNLTFRDERLEEALKEVERYTTVRFQFLDQDLRGEKLTGRYRTGDIDGFLFALGESHRISYEHTDDGRVLLSRL